MKLDKDDLGFKAYKAIKELIVSKQFKPGEKIVQERLADQLGISRTPLRDALQMLEAENLIISIPRKGVMVKEFTQKEIIEVYDCRIALEGVAVSLFTERSNEEEVEELEDLFLPFTKKNKAINTKKYQAIDSQFHNTIISNCGNKILSNLFHKGNLLTSIRMIGLVRPPSETLQEHLDIIRAIKEKKTDLAEKLAKEHLDISRQLILKQLKDNA